MGDIHLPAVVGSLLAVVGIRPVVVDIHPAEEAYTGLGEVGRIVPVEDSHLAVAGIRPAEKHHIGPAEAAGRIVLVAHRNLAEEHRTGLRRGGWTSRPWCRKRSRWLQEGVSRSTMVSRCREESEYNLPRDQESSRQAGWREPFPLARSRSLSR